MSTSQTRRSSTWAVVGAMLAGAFVACAPAPRELQAPAVTPAPAGADAGDAVRAGLGRLPVSFVANQGRWDARASWVVAGAEATAYFLDGGVRWALAGDKSGWALDQVLVGARSAPPTASVPAAGVVSYFGADTHAGLPTAHELTLAQAWPGVDVTWSGTGGNIEATYRLAPGADPDQVRVAWRGAESLAVTDDGRLAVTTPLRTFEEDAPRAFQDIDGKRVPVEVAYELDGTDAYGFKLGPYDDTQPLVIDPTVLVYAGFLGGVGNDIGLGIAVDGAGNAYVTGEAGSRETSFPETTGVFQPLYGDGSSDAFVAKVNPTGSLVYASFLGGTGDDTGFGIAVDAAGNAYVIGQTASSAPSFPVTAGVFQPQNAGDNDAFVAKVNPSGTTLLYAGFLGGTAYEVGNDIAVDAAGNAYVIGQTSSLAATFPDTPGVFGTENAGGSSDAFVAKVNPTGSALLYAGFLGGSSFDIGGGIAVDGAGNAYVTGTTRSAAATFPETPGVFQAELANPQAAFPQDAFVAKVNPTGSSLSYATFLGGNSSESGYDIAVDGGGNAYVTGTTGSTAPSFPATAGVFQPQNAGNGDAFVVKVNPTGSALVFATFLGGTNTNILTGNETGRGIALDGSGNVYIGGTTSSPAASFPETPGAFQSENAGGNSDAFVAKVSPTGSALLYASFLGGAAQDSGNAIAVDAAGNAYVTGEVQSLAATFPETPGALGAENGGLRDAFVAKVAHFNAASHVADFNGDGKTDFGVYRASTGGWYVALAGGGSTSAFWGTPGDVWVPGDYNGDRKTDFGIYRPTTSAWYVALAGGGSTSATWGASGDIPVPGDYNGDGKTDFGVFRPTTGAWYVALAGGGSTSASWGISGDLPVPGDYNGDGKTDFGVFRPTTGAWYVAFAGGGSTSASWGISGDVPVPGDYNGDGKTDFGVYRPSNGGWFVAFAGGGSTTASWGATGDLPAPGDYNGDGKTDFGVYRPSNGGWYVAFSGGGTTSATWGGSSDVPLPLPYAVWKRFYGPA
jgi:hypothetical protein